MQPGNCISCISSSVLGIPDFDLTRYQLHPPTLPHYMYNHSSVLAWTPTCLMQPVLYFVPVMSPNVAPCSSLSWSLCPCNLTLSVEFWGFIFQHFLDFQCSMAFQSCLRSYRSNPGPAVSPESAYNVLMLSGDKNQDWLVAIDLSLFPDWLFTFSCPPKLFLKLPKLHFI